MRSTVALIVVALVAALGWPLVWRAAMADPGGKPDATRKLEIDVETYGDGDNRDTRYAVPTANGPVTVG